MRRIDNEFAPVFRVAGAEVEQPKENPTENVRIFVRNLFQDIFDNNELTFLSGRIFASSELESKIAEVAGVQREWEEERKITPEFQEAVGIFFSELLSFLKEKKKEEPERAEQFMANLHELFFSQSPSLVNYLDFSSTLEFIAKTTRVPEAQAFVGSDMIGEMVNELSFASDESIEVIEERIFTASVAEQLDFLRVIETLGISAAASGDWSLPALERLITVVQDLVYHTEVPFVRFSAQVLFERLQSEYDNPTGSVIHYSGDRGNGSAYTITEETKKDNKRLRKSVNLDIPLKGQDYLVEIAKGCIGVVDQSGLLHSVGKVESGVLQEVEGPSVQDVEELTRFLRERLEVFSLRNMAQVVAFVEQRILSQLGGHEYFQGEFWGRVGGINRETYEELFELDHVINEVESKDPQHAAERLHEEYIREKEIYGELLAHKNIFTLNLLEELAKIRKTYEKMRTQVHMKDVESVVKTHTDDELLLFQQLHHPRLRALIEKEFGFSYTELSLHSLKELQVFLSQKADSALESLQEVLSRDGIDRPRVLEAFLACQADKNIGDKIVELLHILSSEDSGKIFGAYHLVAQQIEGSIEKFKASQGEKSVPFSDDVIYNGLLYRAKDVLGTVYDRLRRGENVREVIESTVQELKKEQPKDYVLSGQFRRLTEVFRQKHDNSVRIENVAFLYEKREDSEVGLFLRALQERDELKPIPEIHWRVDRGSEEYKQRFGFDINELLKRFAEEGTRDQKKLLLEFGPGSGKSKAERQALGLGEKYVDVAMADTIYYPLGEFIYNLLDWEKVSEQVPLSEKQKKTIADALYKTLMIADGETNKDNFHYARERIVELTQNPESIKKMLQEVAREMHRVEVVPSTISTRDADGNVVYPYKIALMEKEVREAKMLLAENMEKFLKEGDVFEYLPAHPSGMMVGDFSEIKKLQDNQIDVAFGVRSTVYKRGEEYIDFMSTLLNKLKSGGVYVDDNIRDNDGWYYRLGEMAHVVRELEEKKRNGLIEYTVDVQLVVGPGFEGEDFSSGEVPLALVIGKDATYSGVVQELLDSKSGFRLVPFGEYIKNKDAIRALDETGYTLEILEAELGLLPPAAGDALAA